MKNKININWEGVAIGSGTVAEHKNQMLNFMNMIYNIAFQGADRKNLQPWIDNLKYEISWVRWHKYTDTYGCKVEHFIDILEDKVKNHKPCRNDWNNLLNMLRHLFELEYTLN